MRLYRRENRTWCLEHLQDFLKVLKSHVTMRKKLLSGEKLNQDYEYKLTERVYFQMKEGGVPN